MTISISNNSKQLAVNLPVTNKSLSYTLLIINLLLTPLYILSKLICEILLSIIFFVLLI